jgi:hypothetical protein
MIVSLIYEGVQYQKISEAWMCQQWIIKVSRSVGVESRVGRSVSLALSQVALRETMCEPS